MTSNLTVASGRAAHNQCLFVTRLRSDQTLRPQEWRTVGPLFIHCPIEFIDTLISEVLECPILEVFG